MALQGITLAWLFMIFRVVAKVLRGEGADDSRSDDEGGDDEENDNHNDDGGISDDDDAFDASDDAVLATSLEQNNKPRFIEISPEDDADHGEWTAANTAVRNAAAAAASAQAGGSSSGNNSRKKSRTPGAGGISSGLNLVGDHKDILNRIGCLSEEQLAREREKRDEGGGGSPKGGPPPPPSRRS
jgi:acyl-CoA-dependent ceramide synthase